MSEKIFLNADIKIRLAAGLIALFCLTHLTAGAQQKGVITGRVINDDGIGVPQVRVNLYPVGSQQGGLTSAYVASITTDEDGNFRFIDLLPRIYQVSVSQTKAYVITPMSEKDVNRQPYYRIGDNVTITLIRGGVITGRVTRQDGEPMIGTTVSPTMVRDSGGKRVRNYIGRPRLSDERGIYRLYGLAPGVYIVSASGASFLSQSAPTTTNSVTYYPSSTADTATEVTVASGGEVTGVDILMRSDRGYTISGTVVGGGNQSSPYLLPSVSLIRVANGASITRSAKRNVGGINGFTFEGISDGEYEIVARRGGDNSAVDFASAPRRLSVKGADVTGIELKLAMLASISGKVVIEPSTGICKSKSVLGSEEILLFSRRSERLSQALLSPSINRSYDVNDDGEFTITSLEAGTYHIESQLPDENWYLRSITIPSAAPTSKQTAAATPAGVSVSTGINLKSGKHLSGVTLVIAEGAAGLQGKIEAEVEGSSLPSQLRIHLVPSEQSSSNDLLRFSETLLRSDGTFEFKNLTPGKYWLISRVVADLEPADRQPAAWDDAERAKLRKEAEALKIEVELKACQRIFGQVLKFTNEK
jgi:Carboxypeptidase regulatory-like domain